MQIKGLLRSDTCSASSPSTQISPSSSSSSWVHLRSFLIMASFQRVRDKRDISSLSYQMERNQPLSLQQWVDLFSEDGKLLDKVKLLKRVCDGGIEPGIRAEVWPFLLGVYDLDSTEAERKESMTKKREEYEKLRVQCQQPENCPVDYATWRRIIRLDAVRTEWAPHDTTYPEVAEAATREAAKASELKDYEHLDVRHLFHATRMVELLEAYAIYDPDTGYCQGMADLLSPIATIFEDDSKAFWCFAAFMLHARHNFRLDEEGIRRQLDLVARILRRHDAALYHHLERQKASDCAFVYRMVVVLLRRELSFEQTLYLWEVLWANRAAVRESAGRRQAARRRQREAPPTEDLLLYAVAACVLQRREMIMEGNLGMEEIQRECNAMAGRLDVGKILDEAQRLVLSLRGKI